MLQILHCRRALDTAHIARIDDVVEHRAVTSPTSPARRTPTSTRQTSRYEGFILPLFLQQAQSMSAV
ncbi:hypothetical protein BAUCODRAFT_34409 [Baudoinia panamericana UAMH 10762]|uniref:Uncharacterized protein n=1 Tax=Baudoinia panamericana (strain UAMH 10762) TaxID=717646 RepID=M2N979_BAUPA|nr:uncharacterized protein BAUCODRAFT_34409 [Baudoinia panamericana UAMH 10762]EMC95649.1 hypothetical protein BAUCODRAFT_34409 [Baudoinia panamericana UAMH 10762]